MQSKEQSKNAIKWIKALLSGKYKQGRNYLGDKEGGFCCWGLGCYITGYNYEPTDAWDNSFAGVIGFNNNKGYIEGKLYSYNNLGSINDQTTAGFKRIGKFLIKHADDNFNTEVAKAIHKAFKNV